MQHIIYIYSTLLFIFSVHINPIQNCPTEITLQEPVPNGTDIFDFSTCISNGGIGSCANVELKVSCLDRQNSEIPLDIFNRTILRTTSELDREQRDEYNLGCIYFPASSQERSTCYSFNFDIYINDSNDNGPVFNQNSYSVEMFENNDNNIIISDTSIISDPDLGSNAEYMVELLYANLTQQNAFVLTTQGGLPGIYFIKNNIHLDREVQDRYNLKLQALDSQISSMNSTATLIVYVKDENDNSPVFLNDSVTIDVREDEEIGAEVGFVLARDQDAYPNNQTKYYIRSNCHSSVNEDFVVRIDENSGILYLNRSIDAENGDERFTANIVAMDVTAPSRSACITLEVNVVDVNDNSPVITFRSPIEESVNENDSSVTNILGISAIDNENGANGIVTLEFSCEFSNCSCSQNCRDYFELREVVATFYILELKMPLDYEISDSVILNFTATDNGTPQRVSSKQFNLRVNPKNEFPPTFAKSSFNCTIREDLEVNTSFCREISATDLDDGADGKIHYRINSENAFPRIEEIKEYFRFDMEINALVLNKEIDFEDLNDGPIFSFELEVSDPGTSSTTNVTIEVKDVNDNPPRITNLKPSSVYSIQENVENGTIIATFYGEDSDSGINGEFNVKIQPNNSMFIIQRSMDGWDLKTNQNIDREATSSYDLTIVLTDNGIPPLESRDNVSIIIDDVNDNHPYFSESMYKFEFFMENDSWTIEVEDADEIFIGKFELDFGDYPELSSALQLDENANSIIFKNPSALQPGRYEFKIYVSDESLNTNLSLAEIPGRNSTTLVLEYTNETTEPPTFSTLTTSKIVLGTVFSILFIIIICLIISVIILIFICKRKRSVGSAYRLQVRKRNAATGTQSILRYPDSRPRNTKRVQFMTHVTPNPSDSSTTENTSNSSESTPEHKSGDIMKWKVPKQDSDNFRKNLQAEDVEIVTNPIYGSQQPNKNSFLNSGEYFKKDSSAPLISPEHELYMEPDTMIANPHANYNTQFMPQEGYNQPQQPSSSFMNPMLDSDYEYDPDAGMYDSGSTTDSEKPPHGAIPIYISSDMTSEGEFLSDNDTLRSSQIQYFRSNVPDGYDGGFTL